MLKAPQLRGQMEALAPQIDRANALRDMKAPKGRSHGDVYMAANPLEMLAAGGRSAMAQNEYDKLQEQANLLRGQTANAESAGLLGQYQQAEYERQFKAAQAADALRGQGALKQYEMENRQPASEQLKTFVDPDGALHNVTFNPKTRAITYAGTDTQVGPEAAAWQELPPQRTSSVATEKAKTADTFYHPDAPDKLVTGIQVGKDIYEHGTGQKLPEGFIKYEKPTATEGDKKRAAAVKNQQFIQQQGGDMLMRLISNPYMDQGMASYGQAELTGPLARSGIQPEAFGVPVDPKGKYGSKALAGAKTAQTQLAQFNTAAITPMMKQVDLSPMSDTDLKKLEAGAPKPDAGWTAESFLDWAEREYLAAWEQQYQNTENPSEKARDYIDNMRASLIIAKMNNGIYTQESDIPEKDRTFLDAWGKERGR